MTSYRRHKIKTERDKILCQIKRLKYCIRARMVLCNKLQELAVKLGNLPQENGIDNKRKALEIIEFAENSK
jgi:hypothetical protein